MRSLVLSTIARGIVPITVLFALSLLLKGHDTPGGGFVAGLVTAAAIVLQALAFGTERTARTVAPFLRHAPSVGLALALAVAAAPLARSEPFFVHDHGRAAESWFHVPTTLVFEIGVYLTVLGSTGIALLLLARGAQR